MPNYRSQFWYYRYPKLHHNFIVQIHRCPGGVERLVHEKPQSWWCLSDDASADRIYNQRCLEENRVYDLHVLRQSGVLS